MKKEISDSALASAARYMAGGRMGASSKAIAAFLTGSRPDGGYYSTPMDEGDFGRCYHFLKCDPDLMSAFLESDLSEMGDRWVAIQKNFKNLEYFYLELCKLVDCRIGVEDFYYSVPPEYGEIRKPFKDVLKVCDNQGKDPVNVIRINL